jgi:hypothetical protein
MRADVAEVRMLLESPDARVRALAARSACPCHGTFELLHELKNELKVLAETDPDKNVRSAAQHTLREAIELNVAEEAKLSRERDREARYESRDRKRAARRHVALRLARRRLVTVRVLVEECGELLRREDPVALGHELTDLLPVRVVGEHHHDAIMAGSRGEERVANGQQRVAFVWVGSQHEQRNGPASRVLPCHEQAERPPADVERLRRRSRPRS